MHYSRKRKSRQWTSTSS